jgi:hypothetical protein
LSAAKSGAALPDFAALNPGYEHLQSSSPSAAVEKTAAKTSIKKGSLMNSPFATSQASRYAAEGQPAR